MIKDPLLVTVRAEGHSAFEEEHILFIKNALINHPDQEQIRFLLTLDAHNFRRSNTVFGELAPITLEVVFLLERYPDEITDLDDKANLLLTNLWDFVRKEILFH